MRLHAQRSLLEAPSKPSIGWKQWRRMFENNLVASGSGTYSSWRHKALLLHCLGIEGQHLLYMFATPDSTTAVSRDETARRDVFDATMTALEEHYMASTNVVTECHRFGQRIQLPR